LVLSHVNVDALLEDVKSAIETILSFRLGADVEVEPLEDIREVLEMGFGLRARASGSRLTLSIHQLPDRGKD
jgi:hypothetical protein